MCTFGYIKFDEEYSNYKINKFNLEHPMYVYNKTGYLIIDKIIFPSDGPLKNIVFIDIAVIPPDKPEDLYHYVPEKTRITYDVDAKIKGESVYSDDPTFKINGNMKTLEEKIPGYYYIEERKLEPDYTGGPTFQLLDSNGTLYDPVGVYIRLSNSEFSWFNKNDVSVSLLFTINGKKLNIHDIVSYRLTFLVDSSVTNFDFGYNYYSKNIYDVDELNSIFKPVVFTN